MFDELKACMNIDRLVAVEVHHCPQSYGCLLYSDEFGPGKKIIYSGDTRPCQNLVNYARGASILIHEATLAAGMEEHAKSRRHTTTGEALDVVRATQPWRTIFTHFSQRFAFLPEINDKHKKLKVLVAMDHMRVKMSHLEHAYRFVELFKDVLGV